MGKFSVMSVFFHKTSVGVVTALTLLVSFMSTANAENKFKLEPIWLTSGLKVPESVVLYQQGEEKFLLVSEIDGDPTEIDGKGGIVKLSLEGEVIDHAWITGLNAPKGLAIYADMLYVADISQLVIIDLKLKTVVNKIRIPGAVFLNDVIVDYRGVVYVSDTRTNNIYRVTEGKPEVYLENIAAANGLKIIGSTLVIGADTTLWLADKDKNLLKLADGFESSIDGVEMVRPGEFLVSCWVGLLYYVHADGRVEKLLDSRAEKINIADIGYDKINKTVYVPNFLKNTLTAYGLR